MIGTALTGGAGASVTADARSFQAQVSVASILDHADRLKEATRFTEAAPLYDGALATARERSGDQEIARALLGRADLRLRIRDWTGFDDAQEALAICERLDLKPGIAQSRLLMGAFEVGRDNRPSATALIAQAIDDYTTIGDRANAARAGFRLSNLMADGDEKQLVLTRTIENARAAGERELEGDALHRIGDSYFGTDRYEESMPALQQAAKLFESLGKPVLLGRVHNSMGRVFRAHGRIDEALREQKQALALHRQGDDPFALAQSLNAVAVTYQRMGYLDEAQSYLDQAVTLAPSIAAQMPNARDFFEANIAGLLLERGQCAAAAPMLEGVIARGIDAFIGLRWAQLGECYLQLNRPADALKAAIESVEKCGPSKDACARALGLRAQTQAAVGNSDLARADAQSALNMLEQLRKQLLPADAFRREFANSLRYIYTALIRLNVAEGDAKAGLEAAEQARARAFLDLLENRSLRPAAASPANALALTMRGPQAGSPLQSSAEAATAADLLATTNRLRSTMVSFWVGKDETFVWVSDRTGSIQSKRIQVSRSTLVRLVRDTKPFDVDDSKRKPFPLVTRGKAPLSLTTGDATWRQLYTLLIAPIRQWLPTSPGALLTIIPHDVLNGVSFAAMKSPSGRYLLEDYTLHYSPAGALFQFTAPLRRPDARTGSMLLVSDPALPKRSTLDEQLPRLPGTRAESTAIAKYMARRGGTTILQDAEASEDRIRELSRNRSVLHFATHAIVREDTPLESQLVLARSGDTPTTDGMLTAEEVYEMRLQADLVVLSACRSAAGAVPGDAMATFARAFLYAGTASLIASLWDVADEPTNQLIPEFYKNWTGGADKAVALRRAQLALLAGLRAGRISVSTSLGPVPLPEHPVFWAGFVLFGEPR